MVILIQKCPTNQLKGSNNRLTCLSAWILLKKCEKRISVSVPNLVSQSVSVSQLRTQNVFEILLTFPVSHSVSQSVSHLVSRSVSHSVSRSVSHLVSRSVLHSVSRLFLQFYLPFGFAIDIGLGIGFNRYFISIGIGIGIGIAKRFTIYFTLGEKFGVTDGQSSTIQFRWNGD